MRYLFALAGVLTLVAFSWAQRGATGPTGPTTPTVPLRPYVPPKPAAPGTPAQLVIFPSQQDYLASAFFYQGPSNPRTNDIYALPKPMAQIMPVLAWDALGAAEVPVPTLTFYTGPTNVGYAALNGMRPPPVPLGSAEAEALPPPHFIDRAVVALQVPRLSAEVWVGNEKLEEGGLTRYFISPPLELGKPYAYDVVVRWYEDGKERKRTLRINVKAGEQPVVMVLGALAK